GDYIAANPKGLYIVDVQYRLAFIIYQQVMTNKGGDMSQARAMLEKLTEEYPNDDNIGQVWSLLGDLYGGLQSTATENYTIKAMMAYMLAVDKAKTPDVREYAIDAATGILTTEGRWQQLADMWQTYYSTEKDGPNALKAIFQIATAYRRLGKIEDAQKLMADHIAPNLGNPKNEQVEMLIQQLVGMIVPKKRPKSSSAAAKPAEAPKPAEPPPASEKEATEKAPASEKPAEPASADTKVASEEAKTETAPPPAPAPVAPVLTFEELEARLKTLLTGPGGSESITNGTAQARVLYARALLARMMRDLPKYESLLAVIPDAAKPEELSPLLLATVGDMLFAKGDLEKASEYYSRLREAFSKSDFGDKAPVGLGRIEFARKNYKGALDLFNEAIDKFQGSSSLLEATLGKAESLLELGKLDEAEKLYKTIAATREWKGEPTANALYHLGLIEERRKAWGKAIAYYQRVILAHQKYKNWLAKSHLHCAQSQISDSKMLRQMLARPDLQEQPEFKEAQALLTKIGN
ncbi:MAG: tetratricopeptide repeat protein, partial [Verrucomicrobia bacterium]|nr:tetratricopeptide repeat protein [Verrucomicrobiota bacterium]